MNAGYLVTEVLDIVDNGIQTLILDASAACHMPDVLEMPYRPPLRDGYEAGNSRTRTGCLPTRVWQGMSSGIILSNTRYRWG